MQNIYESILGINILAPSPQYVGDILQALCRHLGFTFSLVLEGTAHGQWQAFASYNAPDDVTDVLTQTPGDVITPSFTEFLHRSDICVIADPTSLFPLPPWHAVVETHDIRSVIVVPLLSYGRSFGICLLCDTHGRQFSDEELGMMGKVGEMVSIAILSNQYLSQLHQRTQELREEITERQRVETALREALRRRRELEEIVNRSPVIVFLWRAAVDWPVEFVSRSIEHLGYSPDELTDGTVSYLSLIHPDDTSRVADEMQRRLLAKDQSFVLEYRLVSRSGEVRWVENHMWARRDTDGYDLLHVVIPSTGVVTHFQGIIQDITERKHAEEIVRHQAYHDPLTDLPNRALFFDRLSTAIARARRQKHLLAVMFLDLDGFKKINDTLGHAQGDLLLQSVAKRLCARLREEDTVSRLGGDEFTILLPEISDPADAVHVAEKILQAFETPFDLRGTMVRQTTSIGISLFPQDGSDAQTILNCADRALYSVKEEGKNAYRFFPMIQVG